MPRREGDRELGAGTQGLVRHPSSHSGCGIINSVSVYTFDPQQHEQAIEGIVQAVDTATGLDNAAWARILRAHPKQEGGFYSKAEIIRGFRHLNQVRNWQRDESVFLDKVRMKPIRTLSGVAPVTVLTPPYPCPGKCIFCPSDVRMPKSYLSDEPGAQRAAEHRFDPYRQTASRLQAFYNNGHSVNKVELIVLGGTWSSYPEEYQIWLVLRCFEAMNDFLPSDRLDLPDLPSTGYEAIEDRVRGETIAQDNYNQVVRRNGMDQLAGAATWQQLSTAQTTNEEAGSRCVGLVLETRPDHLDDAEITRLRRLGATKVQIGFQSLNDAVLKANHRGHDVAASRSAVQRLRAAGFKIHGHWMANLYGSSPQADIEDYRRMFDDPDFRPDELKIYPCSLIESAELMGYYQDGRWRPYDEEELVEVLAACMEATPRYCRLTRVIRDIPGGDIVDGNRVTNLREVAEARLEALGKINVEIRARETRGKSVRRSALQLRDTKYDSSIGPQVFLEFVTESDQIAGFLRLSLPKQPVPIPEIQNSAMIREVHVYGQVVDWQAEPGSRTQHQGLGTALTERAVEIARAAGYRDLAVISAVGTRNYYRKLGFEDGELYQHRNLADGGEQLGRG